MPVVHALMNAVCISSDILYVLMHFCSLLLLMNFPHLNSTASRCEAESATDEFLFWLSLFSRSGWQDGITDLLGTGVFRKHP